MELGGNAPFIVFDDANLDKATEGALISKISKHGANMCMYKSLLRAGRST